MKFTYNTKPEGRECVAYIDDDGDLILKDREGTSIFVYGSGAFDLDGDAVHKFYPGDSVTITFE